MSRSRKTPRRARLIAGLTVLLAGALAAVALASAGQPGAVDTTFANRGIASFGSGPAAQISFIAAEAVQPDGKVVMVGPTSTTGPSQMGVVRLNRNGSLDTTFGGGAGAVLIGFGNGTSVSATSVALQSNGDIVVAGAAFVGTDQIGVARLTPSGSLDTTFNPTGATPGETTVDTGDTAQSPPDTVGVAVQPADQKIVVVGTQSVLAGGSAFQVSRLLGSGALAGTLDTSFNPNGSRPGTVTTQIGSGSFSTAAVVAIQSNGMIVVAGNGTTNTGSRDFQVARYKGNGTLDGSFNASGPLAGTEDIHIGGEDPNEGASVQAIAIQPSDQKIVLAGGPRGGPQVGFMAVENGHTALVRLNTDGTPDRSFSGGGQTGGVDLVPFPNSTADTANALTIDPVTGTLLVAGTAELAVNGQLTGEIIADRLNPNGSLDATFGDPGMTVLGVGGSAAVDLLNTVANAVDALIGGTVGTKAGAIAITATAPPTTTTTPSQCGAPSVSKKAHDAVRGDVHAVGRGQPFDYVITVANPGPCALANLALSDPLPRAFAWSGPAASNVVFASPTGASPQSLIESSNSHQALVSAAILPGGDSMTVTLRGRATALGRQSDTATLTAAGLAAVPSNTFTLEVTTTPRVGAVHVNGRGVTGTASAGATGPEAALSQIAHVDVAVRALTARGHAAAAGCLWLNGRGRLVRVKPGRGGRCDSPLWLRASGKRRWLYRFRRLLGFGRYQLLVRVTNRAGVYDTTFAPSHHNVVTFKI